MTERPTDPTPPQPTAGAKPRPASSRWLRKLMVLGGFALFGYLLYRTGWGQLLSTFERIGVGAFAVLVLLGAFEHTMDCEALKRAMLGRVGLVWTMASNSAGALVNTVVPFEAGELFKAALLRRRSTHSRVVSGLIIWNYTWKLAKPAVMALCFATAMTLGHRFRQDLHWPLLGGVLISFLPYLGLRLLLRQRPAERLMRLLARVPRLERRAKGGIEAAARLDGEVRNFWRHHPGPYVQVLVLTFLARLVGVAALYVLARRLGLPTDLGSLTFLYAAQMAADYLVMIVPARVGVGEGTSYLLFQTLGLDPTAALVMTITIRLRSLLVQAPLAMWAYLGAGTPPAGAGAGGIVDRDDRPTSDTTR